MQRPDKILILTPLKDARDNLATYLNNLHKISYPHEYISLGLLESDSNDNTLEILKQKRLELEKEFRKVGIWKKDFGFKIPEGIPRWEGKFQFDRRRILAKSRNHLLFHALDDEDWVLWLDVDVVEYPDDIIQTLLRTGKDIVHPHCVYEYHGKTFDLNAWRDRGKKIMYDLRHEGKLAELHSVGGTMLLIKADIHREGLIFPPFLYGSKNKRIRKTQFFFTSGKDAFKGIPGVISRFLRGKYQGEIETEGLGIMAHDMGYTCWGMPNLEIRHKAETPFK
jgi:glycosyltransferase involved in cell wall biosynthesis